MDIEPGSINLGTKNYGDKNCTQESFNLIFLGKIESVAKSSKPEGATNVKIITEKYAMEALTADIATVLNAAATCGITNWKQGEVRIVPGKCLNLVDGEKYSMDLVVKDGVLSLYENGKADSIEKYTKR